MAKKDKKSKKKRYFSGDRGSPEAAREHLLKCKETLLRLCDIVNRGSLDLESYRAFTEFFVQNNYSAIRDILAEDVVLCKLITGRPIVDDGNNKKREELIGKIVVSILMAEVARSIEDNLDQKDEELCRFQKFVQTLSGDSFSSDPEMSGS